MTRETITTDDGETMSYSLSVEASETGVPICAATFEGIGTASLELPVATVRKLRDALDAALKAMSG